MDSVQMASFRCSLSIIYRSLYIFREKKNVCNMLSEIMRELGFTRLAFNRTIALRFFAKKKRQKEPSVPISGNFCNTAKFTVSWISIPSYASIENAFSASDARSRNFPDPKRYNLEPQTTVYRHADFPSPSAARKIDPILRDRALSLSIQ